MKGDSFPGISVIIPAKNEEKRIGKCLESIRNQEYPQEKIEILVIDDGSTDRTAEISKEHGAKVLKNGKYNIEIGKSIGLQNAKNEFLFFIDADNSLPRKDWISRCVDGLLKHPETVGAEAIYFNYNKSDPASNRYCSLFGINDPTVYYLGKRDRLMITEKKWNLGGKTLKETDEYYLVEFNKENLPTVGSQGFLTRKSLLEKTNYKPYLFHMDSNYDLVNQGFNKYLMMKMDVVHDHAADYRYFIKKLIRNMNLYHSQSDMRKYKYNISLPKMMMVGLTMVTLVRPIIDSINGYIKKPDPAWFLHPFFSFVIFWIYGFITLKALVKNNSIWHMARSNKDYNK